MKSIGRLCLFLCIATALAACGGKEERAKSHLEKGKALFAEAEYDKAGVEIRNVLQIDPRSAEAYHLSAQIWERKSELQKAFASYAKAVELAPGHLEAKAKMGRFYLFGGARDKADQAADEILAEDPSNPHGRTLKAALLARDDPKAAAAQARAVLEAYPGHGDASALLASLLAQGKDRASAAKVLAQAVERSPKDASLRLALASLHEREGRFAEAQAELRTLVEQTPRRFEYRSALAALHVRAKEPAEAETVLREAALADADDERRVLVLVEHLGATRGFEAAERELRAFIEERPRAHDLRFGLASLYLNARRNEDAMRVYREIVAADRSGARGMQARGALARLLFVEERAAEAEPLVAEVLKENPRDNTALLLRAQKSLQAGEHAAAIADLRSVLRDQPDSLEVNALLARAHLAAEEPELARESLGRAVSLSPQRPALRYLYVSFLARQGEHDAALREVDELLRARPEDAVALQARAEVQAAAKDFAGAEATLKRIVKAAPESPLGYYRLAQLYAAQKKNAAALAQLELGAAKAPRDVEVLGSLLRILITAGRTEQATTRIKKAAAAHPDDARLQVMLGEYLASRGKAAEAMPVLERALALAPDHEPTRANLARLRARAGDAAGAERLLKEGLERAPRSVPLAMVLAELLQARGEHTGAIGQYEAILKFAPGNDIAANNLAALVADHAAEASSLERALALAKRFERSANPLYLDTLGWVHYRRGEHERAVEVLGRAAQQGDIPVVHFHLGMALHKAGKTDEARTHLRKALEAKTPFQGADEARAVLAKG